jgi:hypothetical protein
MAHKQPSIPSRHRGCIVPLTAMLHRTICSAYLLPRHDREKKHAEKSKFSCTAMHYDGVHVFLGLTIHVKWLQVRLTPDHVTLSSSHPCGPILALIDWAAPLESSFIGMLTEDVLAQEQASE